MSYNFCILPGIKCVQNVYIKRYCVVGIKLISFFNGRKEGNVLFNDTLNTFYSRLYGVKHMVKDHSDSEKGNPLPPHRLLFLINSKGSFICTIPQTDFFNGVMLINTASLKKKYLHKLIK